MKTNARLLNIIRGIANSPYRGFKRTEGIKGRRVLALKWLGTTVVINSQMDGIPPYPSHKQALDLRRLLERESEVNSMLLERANTDLRVAVADRNNTAIERIQEEIKRLEAIAAENAR